ncbi:MAG: NifB/NifX family molybdenum-iron cluster-binding protein [Actinomycetota bacterium]|nr:NifB/NifX family molybdenum-iron cluster-binding protein [Actinomycetota bacterium]
MKVAITSSGPTLQSNVDPRFGRCPYYIIYETEDGSFKAVENKSSLAAGGAGIQAGQNISDMKVEAVVTGNVGPNAFRVLSAASIKIYSGATGSVKDAIDKFKNGEYKETAGPDVESHFGMGRK